MTKWLLLCAVSLSLYAVEIPIKHAEKRAFGTSVTLNSQIVQLSNAKQSVMSLVDGHIEHYYVTAGHSVTKGEKMVLIESIVVSKMTAEYISNKKQLKAQEQNYRATKKLYDKGMASMQELNAQSMQKNVLLAKLNALSSQLKTLEIDTTQLKEATANFTLYAHSDGVVSEILQPVHSSIKADTPIISIVKKQAFYLKSFLPLAYASKVRIGQKIVLRHHGRNIVSHVTQILPKVDSATQRIVLLSSIEEETQNLYINAYVPATLYFDATRSYVAVEKSALSFFQNEWVIFVPTEDEHEEHAGHDHGTHNEHEDHTGHDHATHDDHDDHVDAGHEEHNEDKVPYTLRVVNIIAEDDHYVALQGIHEGDAYVSDKSYYVKSMLLKSSLGGHGH
ncbi:MAG: hypothetical protein DSZ03_03190 [Sulfurimonas sp.]|nr:MAG: hypothetical protein DSZ03_03190 [Sulfurimonas sp.]